MADGDKTRDLDNFEFDLRLQLEQQRAAATEEREEFSHKLLTLSTENSSLLDQLNSSENKLKDFELHIVELEQKVRHMQHDNKEETLRREIALLKSEIDRLSETHDEIKIESNDKYKEILDLRVANKNLEAQITLLDVSGRQFEEENGKLLSMVRDIEKELREAKEQVLLKEKKFKELEFKLAEEVRSKQELAKAKERLASDHSQLVSKLQEENQLLHSLLKRHKEEVEAGRRRGSSSLFGIDGLNLSDFENLISKGLTVPTGEGESSMPGLGEHLDSAIEVDILADLQQLADLNGSNSRRQTLDMRDRHLSLSRERGASSLDSIFHQRKASMSRPAEEKVQAEVFELKTRLKQSQEDFKKQAEELLVATAQQADIESKSKEITSLTLKLAEARKAEQSEGLKEMHQKHKEESLQAQIKNLQIDLHQSGAEIVLLRESVDSANCKLSNIVSDYEINQDILTRKNQTLQKRLKIFAAAIDDIDAVARGDPSRFAPILEAVRAFNRQT